MWHHVVPVGREVVEVCGVPVVPVNVELGAVLVNSGIWDRRGAQKRTGPHAISEEPVPKLSLVTSSAVDWSPFVTVFLLPLMVVVLMWLLLLLLLL